jgi:two-component sensor histidine kinase
MEQVKCFLFSVCIFCSLLSPAQNISRQEIDSLWNDFTRTNPSGINKIRQLNILSKKYTLMNIDTSHLFAKQARELAIKLKDTQGLADALLNISKYYANKPDYSQALDYALQAADQFENIRDNKGLGETCSDISMIYKYLGGDKITESYLAKGIEYSNKGYCHAKLAKDTFLMAATLMQAGIIYRDWGQKEGKAFYYDSAFTVFTKAIALAKSGKAADLTGKLFNNISQVYTEHKKDYHKALEYLMKAIDFNKKNNKTTSLSFNYGNVSANYMHLGNREKALEYAYKTLEIARQTKLPSRLQNSYGQLYRVYEWTGQFDSALTYYKMMTVISDSLLNVEKTAQISDAQTKYETAKKEAEIKTLNISNEAKTRNIYALGAGLLVAIALAISMVFLYRKVQSQKILLSEQSAKLELTMKELHHRVKNNLQIVKSLLSLQSYRIRDAEAVAAMNESKMRVEAMSLIHQRLYNTDMFTTVNIKEYITDLSSSLMAAYGYSDDDFDLQIEVGQEMLDVETALPVGLILNELITNAFKYAYKDIASPALKISLESKDQQIHLEVQDNGAGLDMAKWNKNTGSFGKQLIGSLCNQLRAKQQVTSENGTTFTFTMPAKAA